MTQIFLSLQFVETKLSDAQVQGRLGRWLSETSHARCVVTKAATVLRMLAELLHDKDIQQVLDWMIVRCIAEPQ